MPGPCPYCRKTITTANVVEGPVGEPPLVHGIIIVCPECGKTLGKDYDYETMLRHAADVWRMRSLGGASLNWSMEDDKA